MDKTKAEFNKNWFTYDGQQVLGPLSPFQIIKHLESKRLLETDLIWSREYSQWQPISEWMKAQSAPIKADEELWYVASKGLNQGPLTTDSLVKLMKQKQLGLDSRFWTPGMDRWLPLSQFPELVKRVGLMARKHPRAPFVGRVRFDDGQEIPALALNISRGGMGLRLNEPAAGDNSDLEKTVIMDWESEDQEKTRIFTFDKPETFLVGSEFKLQIESPLLDKVFSVESIVVHRTNEEIGLRFLSIPEPALQSLDRYISEFLEA
ncbi:MAG: DUF4339 domain-containing protein [Oligoflexia bacterium]|nr:DUF4339 domain-containing protein [Oligoflexia bacterium]